MEATVQEPQAPKAKVMLWTDVSYHAMEELDKLESTTDLESALCSLFQIDLLEPKRGVLLELYVQTVLFCREHSFKQEQTSALLSIMKSIHEANVVLQLNIEEFYKYCSELLLCHSIRRPPFSMNIFSSEEATDVLNYIHNNYMRHYKLYKYVFTPQQKLDLTLTYVGIPEEEEPTQDNSDLPGDDENLEDAGTKSDLQESSAEATEATLGLKGLIQQEVREQMMIMSGQLEERMKDNLAAKK